MIKTSQKDSILSILRSGTAGIDEYGQATISTMEKRGTRVSVFSVDVSDSVRVNNLVKEIEEGDYPPLRGIVQSSMVLEDCLAVHSSLQKYFRVSDPKVTLVSFPRRSFTNHY